MYGSNVCFDGFLYSKVQGNFGFEWGLKLVYPGSIKTPLSDGAKFCTSQRDSPVMLSPLSDVGAWPAMQFCKQNPLIRLGGLFFCLPNSPPILHYKRG